MDQSQGEKVAFGVATVTVYVTSRLHWQYIGDIAQVYLSISLQSMYYQPSNDEIQMMKITCIQIPSNVHSLDVKNANDSLAETAAGENFDSLQLLLLLGRHTGAESKSQPHQPLHWILSAHFNYVISQDLSKDWH